jgi:hypothetical protein
MLTERLVARCSSAKPVGVVYAQNYALDFSKPSQDTSGKATLISHEGHNQYGALFKINKAELPELDNYEGAGNGYKRHDDFFVFTKEGEKVFAKTYIATKVDRSLKPFDWYLALIVAGAKQHALPERNISTFCHVSYKVDQNVNRTSRKNALNALRQVGIIEIEEFLQKCKLSKI